MSSPTHASPAMCMSSRQRAQEVSWGCGGQSVIQSALSCFSLSGCESQHLTFSTRCAANCLRAPTNAQRPAPHCPSFLSDAPQADTPYEVLLNKVLETSTKGASTCRRPRTRRHAWCLAGRQRHGEKQRCQRVPGLVAGSAQEQGGIDGQSALQVRRLRACQGGGVIQCGRCYC